MGRDLLRLGGEDRLPSETGVELSMRGAGWGGAWGGGQP